MKNTKYQGSCHHQIKSYLITVMLTGILSIAIGQTGDDNTNKEIQGDTTLAEESGAVEKMTLRVSFEAFKINDELKLMAKARLKVKGKFQNIPNVEMSFYRGDTGDQNLLGKDTSNHNGEAYWILPATQFSDSAGSIQYWAVVQNHPDYEDAEESVSIVPSVMILKLEAEDSVRMVKLFAGYPDETGQIIPLTEAECQIYVKRLFGLLPIGEPETTDEEGLISVEFPADIHGDESGNLTVVAKIAEHEVVGNVEVNKTINWGIPSKTDDFYQQRELWSARANSPIALILIVNAALIGIWGMIGFIILEIIKINKLGKNNKAGHLE